MRPTLAFLTGTGLDVVTGDKHGTDATNIPSFTLRSGKAKLVASCKPNLAQHVSGYVEANVLQPMTMSEERKTRQKTSKGRASVAAGARSPLQPHAAQNKWALTMGDGRSKHRQATSHRPMR